MFFTIVLLFGVINGSTKLRREFCHQPRLSTIVRLAFTVQNLYQEDFEVIPVRARRRRHHSTDLSHGVMPFYRSAAHDLKKVLNDFEIMMQDSSDYEYGYNPVQYLLTVMTDLMEGELENAREEILKDPKIHFAQNLDLVRERAAIRLSRVISSFHSVAAECQIKL